MAGKNEKYIIGLTGNIATGKTVVRKMLEHLGAYGIDADVLSHRVIARDMPGYAPIVEEFGRYILDKDGNIDRKKLGGIVFSDPEGLLRLEAIIHPLVREAAQYLIENASQQVIVLEAIKLLESPLLGMVDSVWVVTAAEDVQIERLMKSRKMSEAEARKRMASQSSQREKISKANVVIHSDKSFDHTWNQVSSMLKKVFPETVTGNTTRLSAADLANLPPPNLSRAKLRVERGKPGKAEEIARFINRQSQGHQHMTRMDVMAAFGEKAFSLLYAGDYLVGLVSWQIENLVACIDDILLLDELNLTEAIILLVTHVEKAARELQAEAAFVFTPAEIAGNTKIWRALDFQVCTPENLENGYWKDAICRQNRPDSVLFFKQLRADRVLRPI